jgi:replication-associated recombination protein RarA
MQGDSDPDAALHYLARLLDAGDIISACRRLLVTANEDIGLAHSQAAVVTKACVDTALQQYLPDAVKDAVYYEYGDNKNEQAAKAYWDKIKGEGQDG